MAARTYGQYCGITTAVELIAERWALLIVRDLLVGPRRYTDLKQGLPRIPTNILSTRLKELQEGGIVRRVPVSRGGLVYELTPYGRELEPILLALGRWGFQRMGEPAEGDVVTPDSLTIALRTAFQPAEARGMPATTYEIGVGPVTLRARVAAGTLEVWQIAPPAPPVGDPVPDVEPDIRIAAGPAIRGVISGELSPSDAIAHGHVAVVDGDPALLERFAATFHIEGAAAA